MKTFSWKISLNISRENEALIPLLINLNWIKNENETDVDAVLRIVWEKILNELSERMILEKLKYFYGISSENNVQNIKTSLKSGALDIEKSFINS